MLIKTVTLSNYRSLGENVRIEFDKLTVLVGPNGSGKSNIMDALRFLSDAMHMGLSGAITMRNGINAVRRWSGGHPNNMRMSVELVLPGSARAMYAFELTGSKLEEYEVKLEELSIDQDGENTSFRVKDGHWVHGPPELRPRLDKQTLALPLVGGDARFSKLVSALQSISVYSIFPDTLRVPQKYSPTKPMSRHGENWVSILRDQPREEWLKELVAVLYKLTGDINDIKVMQAASYLVVQFQHESQGHRKKLFEAAQESDGTLRVAGIATALLQRPPVPLIGIEEPELTVHPGAIPLLYDQIAQASRSSQVVVTTHSPEFLDRLDPEDVRIVIRRDGITSVAPMLESQRQLVKNQLMTLGEVMRIEGLKPQLDLFPEPM